MATFAMRLKEAMARRQMKAVDLAKKTGLSQPTISEYMKGSYEPKQKNTLRIAMALEVKTSYLLGSDETFEQGDTRAIANKDADDFFSLIFKDEPDKLAVIRSLHVDIKTSSMVKNGELYHLSSAKLAMIKSAIELGIEEVLKSADGKVEIQNRKYKE